MTAPVAPPNDPPNAPLRLGLVAPAGTMGQRVVQVLRHAAAFPDLTLAAALVRAPERVAPAQALLPAGVHVTAQADAFAAAVDVVVDFSAPAAAPALAPVLAAQGVAYVVASTGLEAAGHAALAAAAAHVPVLLAANTSLGIHALARLTAAAAACLPHADVEIVEAHHRRKRDAPSGTALLLGAAVDRGRQGAPLQPVYGRGPQSPPRAPGELGYSVLRGGDVVGEHTVYLLVDGERLELTHRCTDAATFARGALTAARWLAGRPPGSYAMADVLGRDA